MSNPYIGEIRIFGGNFAPSGWAFCAGQLLAISENDTLFNLIGTTYGGNGEDTFALPDLRGRAPLHLGPLQGLSWILGETGGAEEVTLGVQHLPQHRHTMPASAGPGTSDDPSGRVLATPPAAKRFLDGVTPGTSLAPGSVGVAGGSQPHENMQPYVAVNFIIALYGVYPTSS